MVIKKIKKQASILRKEARKQTIAAITAAFAFIIALVWRDAIRKIIDASVAKLGLPETAYVHEIIVAIILTIICVVGIMLVSKFGEVKK